MNRNHLLRVFISYSHHVKGPVWKEHLVRAFQVFHNHDLLDVWQDGHIRIGTFWDDEIQCALETCQIAVLLLTPEALKSKYILSVEFPEIARRQAAENLFVLPIVCEPCDWSLHNWIRKTQSPNGSNPLPASEPRAIENIFRQVATEIAERLGGLAIANLQSQTTAMPNVKTYLNRFPIGMTPGLQHDQLFGREQELALLDLSLAQPSSAIVSLVAWGGAGKTMLVRDWLRKLELKRWPGVGRVYAWSFYSQGTTEDRQVSEDSFLAHALNWFGVQCEASVSPWEKGRLLAEAIAAQPTILILDGIEPLLYPPGPMGGQFRSPGLLTLLQRLARNAAHETPTINKGLYVITTREPLTDLVEFQRKIASSTGSVLSIKLENLLPEAGAVLLHHVGANRDGASSITPEDAKLLDASRKLDGHALTLNLLGRYLKRAHNGDINRLDLVNLTDADRHLQGGTTFKMLAVFENWFASSGHFGPQQLAVLRVLGLFDRPADSGSLIELRKVPPISGITDPLFVTKRRMLGLISEAVTSSDKDWNTIISYLTEFGLVTLIPDLRNTVLLDCHPLIREYFARQVRQSTTASYKSAQSRLFARLCQEAKYQPDILEEMEPLYQAVYHGCQADQKEKTFREVYKNRILRETEYDGYYSLHRLGAIGTDLIALASFFDKPWSLVSLAFDRVDRAMILSEAAFRLRALGRLSEALDPIKRAMAIYLRDNARSAYAVAQGNLGEVELLLGNIKESLQHAEEGYRFAKVGGGPGERRDNRATLAHILQQAGKRVEAGELFEAAERVQSEFNPEIDFLYSIPGFQYCEWMSSPAERAVWLRVLKYSPSCIAAHSRRVMDSDRVFDEIANRASTTLQFLINHNLSILSITLDKLTLARMDIYRLIVNQHSGLAINIESRFLNEALRGLRQSGSIEYLLHGLLIASLYHFVRGEHDLTRKQLAECQQIAERGPMPLFLADVHLHRARMFRDKAELAKAAKLIRDLGYGRRYDELADAEEAAKNW